MSVRSAPHASSVTEDRTWGKEWSIPDERRRLSASTASFLLLVAAPSLCCVRQILRARVRAYSSILRAAGIRGPGRPKAPGLLFLVRWLTGALWSHFTQDEGREGDNLAVSSRYRTRARRRRWAIHAVPRRPLPRACRTAGSMISTVLL